MKSALLLLTALLCTYSLEEVLILHLILSHHGQIRNGAEYCGENTKCSWFSDSKMKILNSYYHDYQEEMLRKDLSYVTVAVYNVHTLWEVTKKHIPNMCDLQSNFSLVESEESHARYGARLFDLSFKYFDGYSTTHPNANIQRVYKEAFLNQSDMLPISPFENLIKGASYTSSHCIRPDKMNSHRDDVVVSLRSNKFRVDGLSNCLRSPVGPEKVILPPMTNDDELNLQVKRKVIAKYLFHLAFENTIETGYVTEKVFDALLAGIVPVYLGDAEHCKKLLPHPKAAIFLSDFNNDVSALSTYLKHLTTNKTAYEVHREWHTHYNPQQHQRKDPLLATSWSCRVCQWALTMAAKPPLKRKKCLQFT